jgi:hypothetical protein
MGQINYTTRTRINGPFLIDREHLEQLDAIMFEEERRLKAANSKAIRETAEKQFREEKPRTAITEDNLGPYLKRAAEEHPFRESARKLVVSFKDKRSFQGESFAELLRQPEVREEVATRFDYSLRVGAVECKVRGMKNGANLYIETFPDYLSESREAFGVLRQWATRIEAPRWQQALRSIYGIFIFVFIFVLLSLFDSAETRAKEFKTQELKTEAKQLLGDGLKPDEQVRAIEIMLALQTEFVPTEAIEKAAPTLKKSVAIQYLSAVACLILSIWPSMELGIGKGENRIRGWRWWLKIVFYSIPGWVIGVFFLPRLETAIRSLF